eukprot:Seg1905.6 transcript_id=Seg1905.6/GoldUCD/mRNA.D3Y31 product="Dopamine D2-like receptor" protein_id=Seg1905.6/GoldUCD/D3Y31
MLFEDKHNFYTLMICQGIISFILNFAIFVILVYFKKPLLMTTNNKLLCSMTIADMLVGICGILYGALLRAGQSPVIYKICAILPMFCSMFASITSIIILTANRLIAIKYPLRYYSIVTTQRTLITFVIIWAIPATVYAAQTSVYLTTTLRTELAVRSYLTTIFFTVGSAVLVVSNCFMYAAVKRQMRMVKAQNRATCHLKNLSCLATGGMASSAIKQCEDRAFKPTENSSDADDEVYDDLNENISTKVGFNGILPSVVKKNSIINVKTNASTGNTTNTNKARRNSNTETRSKWNPKGKSILRTKTCGSINYTNEAYETDDIESYYLGKPQGFHEDIASNAHVNEVFKQDDSKMDLSSVRICSHLDNASLPMDDDVIKNKLSDTQSYKNHNHSRIVALSRDRDLKARLGSSDTIETVIGDDDSYESTNSHEDCIENNVNNGILTDCTRQNEEKHRKASKIRNDIFLIGSVASEVRNNSRDIRRKSKSKELKVTERNAINSLNNKESQISCSVYEGKEKKNRKPEVERTRTIVFVESDKITNNDESATTTKRKFSELANGIIDAKNGDVAKLAFSHDTTTNNDKTDTSGESGIRDSTVETNGESIIEKATRKKSFHSVKISAARNISMSFHRMRARRKSNPGVTKRNIDMAHMCIFVVIAFILCWLPLVTYRLRYLLGMEAITWFRRLALFLATGNSMVNPCIYLLKQKSLRKYIKRIWRKPSENPADWDSDMKQ